MILTDNALFLRDKYPLLWDRIKSLETIENKEMIIQTPLAKNGQDTLFLEIEGRSLYIHSKYNPQEEADRFVEQFSDVSSTAHLFFYGVGLGYHIDAFLRKYPNIKITLYEPEVKIMYEYLSRNLLKDFAPNQLKTVFVENNTTQIEQFINQYVEQMNEEIILVQLPSYERVFIEKYKTFSQLFLTAILNRKSMFNVYSSFEKRWTYNSLLNFSTTVKTPNILLQKKKYFEGKPVVIVAAGPSLQEEIDHLKQIKEQGSAYIFSVGTAINALIANGIEPDAACTYDPSNLNRKVFEGLHLKGISHIPLIYGTSVGYEVLKDYLGPKLHMVTSQDAVSNYYLRTIEGQSPDVVFDASSIAIVTLHLLYKLNCNPIILVGQNLAYKNDLTYADNANVFRVNDVSEQEKLHAIYVESVDGEQVQTTKDFNVMRTQMEMLTKGMTDREIINTTQGGARIADTVFMSLKDVMTSKLTEKVVLDDWYAWETPCYDAIYADQQAKLMQAESERLLDLFEKATKLFNDLNRAADRRNTKQLSKLFPKFDQLFSKILSNQLFTIYIKPMNKVGYEILLQKIESIRFENNYTEKARKIIQDFGKFIYGCHSDAINLQPLLQAIHQEVIPNMQRGDANA